jgi:hypothetical protein
MLQLIREIYLTAFISLSWVGGWDLRTNRAASSAVIALIESGLLFEVASLSHDVHGTTIFSIIPKWVVLVSYLAIGALNHYMLIVRGSGIKFEREFSQFKKTKKVYLLTTSVIMMLTAIAFVLYSASVHRKLLSHS